MSPVLILRVFIPFALGFYLSYLFRSINGVISPDLVRDLGVNAAGLGLITSAYFITFAAIQLPLGILLDRYGPRRTEAVLMLFAAAGAAVFALAETVTMLIVGRALIGFGVSACLMAAFKAFNDRFPRARLPFVNSLMFATGGVGGMSATAPVEAALQFTDWRGVFFFLAAASLMVAALVFFVVPDRQKEPGDAAPESLGQQIRGVIHIFTSPAFLRIAPFSVLTQGSTIATLGLWAGPWMRDVGGLDRATAATGLLAGFAALTAGYLIFGSLAERLSRRGWKVETVAIFGMSAYMVVQVAIIFDLSPWPMLLWIGVGFFGQTGGLCYASLSQAFPPALSGRVNTAVNLLVFVSAFAVQLGVGAVIDLWPGPTEGVFAAAGYQAAFGIVLLAQLAGFLWLIGFGRVWFRTAP